MKTILSRGHRLSCWVLLASACSGEAGDIENSKQVENVGQSHEALVAPSFLYLRCNSTSWGVDDNSRLVATTTPGVFELGFEVREAWMTAIGDDCILTETPTRNAWGNWQRFFGASSPLVVPTTTRYFEEQAASLRNFRVRFPAPGSYKAVVDTKTSEISFSKVGRIVPGEVAWTASGELLLDAAQNLYRVDPERSSLQKLEKATGKATWTHVSTEQQLYPEKNCLSSAALFVREANGASVVALTPATGATQWSTNLGTKLAIPGIATGGLACPDGSPSVQTSYYAGRQYGVVGLNRTTGELAWRKNEGGFVFIRAATSEVTVYSVENPTTFALRFVALNPLTGAVRWTYAPVDSNELILADKSGKLFRKTAAALQRLVPTTGAVQWSRAMPDLWPNLDGEAIYATGSSYVEKLNKANGSVLWTFGDRTSSAFSTFTADASGRCVSYQPGSPTSVMTAIDCATGLVQFSRTFAGYGFPAFDKQGRIYFQAGQLSLLDTLGNVAWNYTPPAFEGFGQASVSGVLDSDSSGIYVLYATPGFMTAPMGLAALSPASGAARWSKFDALNMYFVGSNAQFLFMEEATRGGPVQGRAYAK